MLALALLLAVANPPPREFCPSSPPGPGALGDTPRCFPAFRFDIHPLSPDARAKLHGKSFHEGCPVGLESLSEVTVSFWDFRSQIETGRIIVASSVAKDVARAFRMLYEARFPIARLEPVDAFDGDDDRAMAADDSSGFNCRDVAGAKVWSEHARGLAIDLNPRENPMVDRGDVKPPGGRGFVDRHVAPGVVVRGGPAWKAFHAIGWKWGGAWKHRRDYQHFSRSGR